MRGSKARRQAIRENGTGRAERNKTDGRADSRDEHTRGRWSNAATATGAIYTEAHPTPTPRAMPAGGRSTARQRMNQQKERGE